ncbi:hypothetical protein AHAS_Ahas15G0276900 [Arachis hypogaea]
MKKLFYKIPIAVAPIGVKYETFVIESDEDIQFWGISTKSSVDYGEGASTSMLVIAPACLLINPPSIAVGIARSPRLIADIAGEAHLYKMEKVIFEGKSEFQELLVFESAGHGKVAILNGYLQLTEKDEFAYQEMLTHLALCSIPNPKKVLLVGGGDGGILREISRHSSVEHIDICEMDTMIIDVYKQFFPDIAVGYKDPRVHVHIAEGIGFIKSVPQGTYDVIILDAFNSMGPSAKVLSKKSFLESVAKGLRAGGVMSAPADSLWRKGFVVADTIALCKKIFKGSVNYAWTTIPAYPSGAIGFMLCSTEGPEVNFKIPVNPLNPKKNGVAKGPTKFYNNEVIHLI